MQASVAVLRAALGASDPDAFFVGCFGDPAIAALREVTRAPVVGLGTAALVQAQTVTSRFGLLTTLDRGVPSLWAQLESAGAARSCVGILAAHPPGREQACPPADQAAAGGEVPQRGREDIAKDREDIASGRDDLASRLAARGRELLEAGADGLVLACAAFSPMTAALASALEVPVCDGVALGACIAHGLWASGVWTSKSGAYAWSDATLGSARSAIGCLAGPDQDQGA